MIIIPQLILRNGRCIIPGSAKNRHEKIINRDPVQLAIEMEMQGIEKLLITDINLLERNSDNHKLIRQIIKNTNCKVIVAGGIRKIGLIYKLFNLGVSQIVVGTRGILDGEWLKDVTEKFPQLIIASIDVLSDELLIKGRTETAKRNIIEYINFVDNLKIGALLYTNVSAERDAKKFDLKSVVNLKKQIKNYLIVNGGINSDERIDSLANLGIYGSVLRMDYILRRTDLTELVRRLRITAPTL